MRGIEGVAAAHGLLVMYTPPVPTHYHRPPHYDARFFEWERERERESLAREGQVLWVYRDRDLERAIRAAGEGETDVVAESSSSPAAEINWAMKRLATRLSPAFQRAIDKAARKHKERR